ncbi:hypothetical protein [Cellulomonas sp. NPDC058312]|uniref:hypothetical protein n=1 Tax=Cellulomonas sp. NPDC058312 TaxID=3346441 RepID=UPI0036E40622
MKNMKNAYGAVALPFHAPTFGSVQGTALSGVGRSTGTALGFGGVRGTAARLRARDLAIAPDSVPGGPVI